MSVNPGNTGAPPGVLNGPVLDSAEWAMRVKNADPSLHRLKNAFGLTGGLFIGRNLMNLLTGQTPGGEDINREDVPAALRPLHGVMHYNHFSDDPNDRWMKVVDNWIPAFIGAGGAIAGTYDFAMTDGVHSQVKNALKNPANITLDQAEVVSKFTQSHPWRMLSGLTSMFGSSSGAALMPGITNYGSTLGLSFANSVARDKMDTRYAPVVGEFFTGNKHPFPFGPTSLLGKLREQMLHNPSPNPQQEKAMAYSVIEQWFGEEATQAHADKFLKEIHTARDKFFQTGGVPEKLKEQCGAEIDKVIKGVGLEKTFRKIGLDPMNAQVGRNGFVEYMARLLGSGDKLDAQVEAYRRAYAARNNLPYFEKAVERAAAFPRDKLVLSGGGTVVAIGAAVIGAMALRARKWHKQDNEALLAAKHAELHDRRDEDKESTPAQLADILVDGHSKSGKNLREVLNEKPLQFLEWATEGLNSPETLSTHRLSCAFGLTGGGYAGMKLMEALTGRNFAGAVVPKDKVPEALHKIYGKLAYNPFSDHPRDRWGYVLHLAVPALMATGGIIGASSHFFRKRAQKADHAEFIDDFEDKMTMEQARPWTLLTATSSLLNTPSGNIVLPIPGINYGMSLGTRFTLSAGRKVIFPGLGEFWSANASRYPLGPSALRDYMVKYAVNNPSEHPEQLEEMAIGILRPWYKDITGDQILAFVRKVEEDREKFLQAGGVPEEAKKELEKTLIAHFKGAGLEKTLVEIGLDPLKADIGNNGFSGQIARWLGADHRLNSIHDEFAEKYAERVRRSQGGDGAKPQLST